MGSPTTREANWVTVKPQLEGDEDLKKTRKMKELHERDGKF